MTIPSTILKLGAAVWKTVKTTGIICGVMVSLTCFGYLFLDESPSILDTTTELTTDLTTTSSFPETSSSFSSQVSTSSSSTTWTTPLIPPIGIEDCLTDECVFGCCSIDRRSCALRCEQCLGPVSTFTSQIIWYLAASSGCSDIHLVLVNCSTDLQANWLNIPNNYNILSLSILMRLDSFGTSAFTSEIFRHTESILLADVPITELQTHLFHDLANLQQLKLINIFNLRVNTITENLFSALVRLRVLEIAEMTGEMAISQVVGRYDRVEILSLHDNQITYIYPGILSRLPELVELNVKNSKVRYIYTDAFAHLPKLLRLNLSHNNIVNFANGLFEGIVSRTGALVDISFQPWLSCDCSLLEIKSYLQSPATKDVFKDPQNIICLDPISNEPTIVKTWDVCDWGLLYPDFSNCEYCLIGNKLIIQ